MAVFTRYSFRVCAAQKRQASSLVSPATAVDDTHGRLRAGTLLATAVDDSLKPVLNWANVCSPNILRTLRRTMIRFLIELLVRRTWFGQSKLLLRSQLARNEMQASARTCGRRAADSMIKKKCRLKSSQVKSIYFNHPSQGNSTNCYIILGPRDKAAPPTSQQISKFPLKQCYHPFVLFLPHPQESSLLSANQRQDLLNRVNIPRTC